MTGCSQVPPGSPASQRDEALVGEGREPALHREPSPLTSEAVAVAHDVGEVSTRWALHLVVLVVCRCAAHPPQPAVRSRQLHREVGVFAAVAVVALVEAAELAQHRAPQKKERAEEPVRLDRAVDVLVEVVMRALALERREQPPERRAADERKLARIAFDKMPDLARAEKEAGRTTPR